MLLLLFYSSSSSGLLRTASDTWPAVSEPIQS
jgi:hypothetical protein